MEFKEAADLCTRALSDLKIAIKTPPQLKGQPPASLGDQPAKDLIAFFSNLLKKNRIPAQAISLHAANLTHRVQLLRAFDRPDDVINDTCGKVLEKVKDFPKTAQNMLRGKNRGDVLDPYFLSAVRVLVCAGDFENTVSAAVAHKALMKIENLLGGLHQNVIGAMRGNIRAPEPGGRGNKETLDLGNNPFPGADIVQPPLQGRALRFHQVKSKTGSEKGGSGKRLGDQLKTLTGFYGGEAFYDALVGNTLQGHRTITGVRNAAPEVVVLVGEAAFRELTGSGVGPQLLLRLYQSAFEAVSNQSGYSLESVVATIYLAFKERAEELGEGFLETVLHDAIYGAPEQQDSRRYVPRRRGRSAAADVEEGAEDE